MLTTTLTLSEHQWDSLLLLLGHEIEHLELAGKVWAAAPYQAATIAEDLQDARDIRMAVEDAVTAAAARSDR